MDIIDVLLLSGRPDTEPAVRQAIEACPDIAIAGEAADTAQLLLVARDRTFDVVVAELDAGLELAGMLKTSGSDAACVLLAADFMEAAIADALRRGARACVLVAEMPSDLGPAVRDAAEGEIHLSEALSKRMIKWFAHEYSGC